MHQSRCAAGAETSLLLFLQMDNQLRSGCSMTYTFIERRSLVRKSVFMGLFPINAFDSNFPSLVLFFHVYFPALISHRANVAL